MAVEIDQSGKIEQLNTTTVISCANDTSSVLSMRVPQKRKLFVKLRTSVVPRKDQLAVIYAVLTFLLLRQLRVIPSLIILDEEYTGKDAIIIETLAKLLERHTKRKWRGVIRIAQVGKHSPAHEVAWRFHRSKKTKVKMVIAGAEDVLRWWQ